LELHFKAIVKRLRNLLAIYDLLAYSASVNSKHKRTLLAIFELPTSTSIAWEEIESMLVAIGCTLKEGAGSRVRFTHGRFALAVHRPHPRKEAKQYLVRDVRDFLKTIGVTP
jgi:HicA toxin of bacterial toxin-antitoxin,